MEKQNGFEVLVKENEMIVMGPRIVLKAKFYDCPKTTEVLLQLRAIISYSGNFIPLSKEILNFIIVNFEKVEEAGCQYLRARVFRNAPPSLRIFLHPRYNLPMLLLKSLMSEQPI